MLKQWIGKQSIPVTNVIERGAVKKFAEATGDLNPLYIDEGFAQKSRYQGLIAPPTFEKALEYGQIEGLPYPKKGAIFGEQTYFFNRPLKVGESISCYIKLEDVYEKESSKGTLTFLVLDRVGEDLQGERIYTARSIIVLTETVRKELGV